jgi:hypothetical protein
MIVTVECVDGAWAIEEVVLSARSSQIQGAIQVDDRIVTLWRRHLASEPVHRPGLQSRAAWQNLKSRMEVERRTSLRKIEAQTWEDFWWMVRSAIVAATAGRVAEPLGGAVGR